MPIRTEEQEAEILWEKQVVMSSTRKQAPKRRRQVIARASVLGTVQVGILCTIPSSSEVLKRVETAPKCHDVVRMMGASVLMKGNVVSLKMEPALGVARIRVL